MCYKFQILVSDQILFARIYLKMFTVPINKLDFRIYFEINSNINEAAVAAKEARVAAAAVVKAVEETEAAATAMAK